MHWPLTLRSGEDNFPKKADGSLDYGVFVPHEDTWIAMEQCARLGLAEHIGLSNFNKSQVWCSSQYPRIICDRSVYMWLD